MSEVLVDGILKFWFGPLNTQGLPEKKEKSKQWWKKDPEFDQSIQNQYGHLMELAPMGAYDRWSLDLAGRAALIILLDQFPRNLYRGKARAFYTDAKALVQTLEALTKGEHLKMPLAHAYFTLMPLMHAEDLVLQDLGIKQFQELEGTARGDDAQALLRGAVDFAKQHRDIIVQFGRFPHRNEALGRESSRDELDFLKNGGATF